MDKFIAWLEQEWFFPWAIVIFMGYVGFLLYKFYILQQNSYQEQEEELSPKIKHISTEHITGQILVKSYQLNNQHIDMTQSSLVRHRISPRYALNTGVIFAIHLLNEEKVARSEEGRHKINLTLEPFCEKIGLDWGNVQKKETHLRFDLLKHRLLERDAILTKWFYVGFAFTNLIHCAAEKQMTLKEKEHSVQEFKLRVGNLSFDPKDIAEVGRLIQNLFAQKKCDISAISVLIEKLNSLAIIAESSIY